MKIAIIDLGSNSFHMVLYSVKRDRSFKVLERRACVNALGRYLTEAGELPYAKIKESAEIVHDFLSRARCKGAGAVHVFGTGIFRGLSNATELIDEIFKKSGLIVDKLTQKEEAGIIYAAAKNKYQLGAGSLVIDIGGGSSEFIYTGRKSLKWFNSIAFGTAVILKKFQQSGKITARERSNFIKKVYDPVFKALKKKKIGTCYGTAGFLRYVAHWLGKTRDFAQPVSLTKNDINKIYMLLRQKSFCKGSSRERELVYIGVEILLEAMQTLSIKTIVVSNTSSREGYLLKILNKC